MVAIVDGGSTKCDWVILENNRKKYLRTETKGLNPNTIEAHLISQEIKNNTTLSSIKNKTEKIFFYGAGCGTPENQSIVKKQIQKVFPQAEILIKEDLTATAYSAYKGNPAIVCILGTGSNSCFFDGKKIYKKFPSLGFLLGDEGSGCAIGKILLRDYFMKKLPQDLEETFWEKYGLTINGLIQKIYHNPHANAYLASFNHFVAERISHPYFHHLIHKEMKNFFEYHVLPYEEKFSSEISFVGSIAFIYRDILKSIATEYKLSVGTFIQKPIDNLIDYHKKYLLKSD